MAKRLTKRSRPARSIPLASPDIPLLAVVGHPVAQSLSPELFTRIARATGQPLEYRRLDLAREEMVSALGAFARNGFFRGWNITIPHKETVAANLERLSPAARAMGAVNTIVFDANGGATGHNTDVLGIEAALAHHDFKFRGACVWIAGAGGAAAAAAWLLARKGAREIRIANRRPERAQALARRMGREFPRTRFIAQESDQKRMGSGRTRTAMAIDTAGCTLLINATPVGMAGYAAASPLPAAGFAQASPEALAFDMVYRPLRTPFLRAAESAGLATVDGLEMLIGQALGAYRLWFGAAPANAKQLSREIHRDLKSGLETDLKAAAQPQRPPRPKRGHASTRRPAKRKEGSI